MSAEGASLKGGVGACSPRKCLLLGPQKCHFLFLQGEVSWIKTWKNANYSVTLLFICQPLVYWYKCILDLCIINCKCGYSKRARRLPLRQENSETRLSIFTFLSLCDVEYCQRGQPLLTYSAWKRGFQSLHAAKTAFGSAGWHKCLDHHRCDDWVLNSPIKMNSAIFTQFSFRKIAAIIR